MSDAPALRPLAGRRVLDLSIYLPGPLATRILADFGAEVIKVESPAGDPARYMPPLKDGVGAGFGANNFGKQSVVIDLKRPAGVTLLHALVERSDIVVETFRPGVLDRLGIGYEALSSVNEEIILCSISGYGQSSPLREVAGHDLNYISRAGVLGLFGPPDSDPWVPGVQIADIGGGAMSAAIGVLAATLEREATGRGRHLDISMTRSAMTFMGFEVGRRLVGPAEPVGGGMLTGGLPCYRVYRTKDGRHMSLGALEPKFFAAFCERVGRPELMSEGFQTGEAGAAAMGAVAEIFAAKTQAEWVTFLDGCDCCCEPVRTAEEAMADPSLGHTVAGTDPGWLMPHFGATPQPPDSMVVPQLGQHTRAVVEALGIPAEVVSAAADSGAISI